MANEVEIIGPTDVEKALVAGVALPEVENSADVARLIVERILSAETEEELFASQEAMGWREYEGRTMEVRGVRWNRSSYDQGAPVYAVVDAVDIVTGQFVTLTTGSKSVMATLLWYDIRAAWPTRLVLQPTKGKTAEGFQPYRLVKPQES